MSHSFVKVKDRMKLKIGNNENVKRKSSGQGMLSSDVL